MTEVWPLRFRDVAGEMIFSDESGGWFVAGEEFLDRYATSRLEPRDVALLRGGGHAFENVGDLAYSAFLHRWSVRHTSKAKQLGYLILVPTLRCNLACDYCQVSRAPQGAAGFDWTTETLADVLAFIDGIEGDRIKIEFQGGEPLLRLDLLCAIRAHCRSKFKTASFVVCSNFVDVPEEAWAFFEDSDTFLSTSIDGGLAVQSRQRTHSEAGAAAFFANAGEFVRRYGGYRFSALPTVDLSRPVPPDELIEAYVSLGLTSIYLRPVNRQGFARRAPAQPEEAAVWAAYHRAFIEALVEHNARSEVALEEFYLTHALRRILRRGIDTHVDLRNPARMGDGYVVIDYDGALYPTDEARMMARVGQIDLSIGSVHSGIDAPKLSSLNAWAANDLDPDCQHCAYQPFCGTDVIDDISRHGRIDLPRHDTWFCQRHLALFDLAFELLRSDDPKVQHSVARWVGVERLPPHLLETHR